MDASDDIVDPQHDETALSLFRRLQAKPIQIGLDFIDEHILIPVEKPLNTQQQRGVRACNHLEIFGRSGSGKSELLYHTLLSCVLPTNFQGIPLDGQQCGVIVFDLDYRFSVTRLVGLLEERITSKLESLRKSGAPLDQRLATFAAKPVDFIGSEHFDELVQVVLPQVFVIKCQSINEFIVGLRQVPHIIQSANKSSGRYPVRLMMIDNVASFYWLLKSQDDLSFYEKLTAYLKDLLQTGQLALITTKPLLFGAEAFEAKMVHKEFLPSTWSNFVDARIILRREAAPAAPYCTMNRTVNVNEAEWLSRACSFTCQVSVQASHKTSRPSRFFISHLGISKE